METFTPLTATIGGMLLGGATAAMFYLNGRITGISGIVGGLFLRAQAGDRGWRAVFLAGLLTGGILLRLFLPGAFQPDTQRWHGGLAAAGLLVGLGTYLANGCTSGHGVCGISRLSPRSFVATVTFIAVGALVVYLMRRWTEGS